MGFKEKNMRLLPHPARLFADAAGVTALEYGLIAALIAVAAVTLMSTIGTSLTNTFNTISGSF
jgi:pilus assembly protein Flp/PilA